MVTQHAGGVTMRRDQADLQDQALEGKRVVILGGTSGIGLASARAAAAEGAAVVVASRSRGRVDAALARLPEDAQGYPLDVSDEPAVAEFFGRIGPVDHLVFSAEPLLTGAVSELNLEEGRHFFETRYWGTMTAVKHANGHIRPDGSITLSSGSAAARPPAGFAVAASICGAIEALTRALAVELAPVRVNAVAPGVVKTEMWDPLPPADREALYDSTGRAMLTGRVAEPAEIAQAHLYLMRNSFTTGTVVAVDGGAALV